MTIKNTFGLEASPSSSDPNMPIGSITPQGAIQYASNPINGPQLQPSPLEGPPSQANRENWGLGEPAEQPVMTRQQLQELVMEVDPTLQLDEEVVVILLQMADNFIDATLKGAVAKAQQRRAPAAEIRDVEDNWNMGILEGLGNDELHPYNHPV